MKMTILKIKRLFGFFELNSSNEKVNVDKILMGGYALIKTHPLKPIK